MRPSDTALRPFRHPTPHHTHTPPDCKDCDGMASAYLWCGRCGAAAVEGNHADCQRALELEPPRYCIDCRRRMVVQVIPLGWTARCVEHGDISST